MILALCFALFNSKGFIGKHVYIAKASEIDNKQK
jgi:hypothetical protein